MLEGRGRAWKQPTPEAYRVAAATVCAGADSLNSVRRDVKPPIQRLAPHCGGLSAVWKRASTPRMLNTGESVHEIHGRLKQ